MVNFVMPTTSIVDRPEGWGYGARLDELLLRLSVSPDRPLVVETARDQAQRIQTEATAEDFVPEFGQVFSRSNFTAGEGLDFAHRVDQGPNDSMRFWDSKGLAVFEDAPGELQGVSLLFDIGAVTGTGTDTEPYMVVHPDGYLIVCDGQNVKKVTTPLGTPGVTNEDPFSTDTAEIDHICLVGNEVWATGSGATSHLAKRSAAGSWSNLPGALDVDSNLWYAKGRLMGAVGPILHEINETTGVSSTTLHTLPSGEVWHDVIDAGPIILAAGGGQVFMFQDISGTLTLVNQSTITTTDEAVSLGFGAGVVAIGTREPVASGGYRGRLYHAIVGSSDNSFALADLQVIRTWDPPGGANSSEPRSFFVTRDSVYMIVMESTTETNMWRYYFPSGGVARDMALVDGGTGAAGYGLAKFDDKFIASVGSNGVLKELDTHVTAGYLITPAADHFTAASKSWLGVRTNVQNLEPGGQVEVMYSLDPDALTDPDSLLWSRAQLITGPEGSGLEVSLPGAQSRWIMMQMKVASSGGGVDSPQVVSIATRGFIDTDELLVTLPVNVSDRIERPGRHPINVAGWGQRVMEELLGRKGSPVVCEVYAHGLTIRGTVEAVQVPTTHIAQRGSASDYALVLVRGSELDYSTSSTNVGSLGIGTLGIQLMGV